MPHPGERPSHCLSEAGKSVGCNCKSNNCRRYTYVSKRIRNRKLDGGVVSFKGTHRNLNDVVEEV